MDTTSPNVDSQDVVLEKQPRQRLSYLQNGDGVKPERNGDITESKSPESGDEVVVETEVQMQRRVGLISGIALIVGTMIGSGIFVSPKGVLRNTGSVGLCLIVWAICGVLSMMGALSLAELGTLITKSGGEFAYLYDAFLPFNRFLAGIPCFLFAWISAIILKPSSVAIISLTCSEYILTPLYDDGCGTPPYMEKKILAAVVILLLMAVNCYSVRAATQVQTVFTGAKLLALFLIMAGGLNNISLVVVTGINCWSVRMAAQVQVIFTVAKLIAIAIIIVGGVVRMAQGYTKNLANGFEGTTDDVAKIALSFYSGLWSYDGWNNLNYVTEEIVNPNRNLPLAIWIAIPLVTICYLLVNVSYFTVMSPAQLLASPAVAVTWGKTVLVSAAWIIPVSVALSTFGAVNGTVFSTGRLNYAAAREGHMVNILSMVHVKKFTPMPSIIFTTIIALLMIIPADIESLIDFFNFAAWIFYGLTMLAVIILRFTQKDSPRPYKVPIIFPIIVFFASVYLVIAPIVSNPRLEFLLTVGFLVLGFIIYVPFVHFKVELPGMSYFTKYLQLLMEVAPTDVEPAG